MKDDKLKVIVAILGGIIFGFIFILLAFVLPLHSKPGPESPDAQLRKLSQQIKKNAYIPPPDRP